MPKIKAKEISQRQLIQAVSDASQNGSSVCYGFILGAGASFNSKIPTGRVLAEKWYSEIKASIDDKALEDWTKKITDFDETNLASAYTKIFAKRFEVDYQLGYQELQRLMDKAVPSIGYSFLAQILAETAHKFIITTNFDTMSEDALFDIKDAKPLVLGHEVLSKFINANSPTRPTIIKIHRDFLFDPYNTEDEIQTLDKQWQEALQPVLCENAMIVLGYGGNDESLMGYLKQIENRKPIYWCYRNKEELSNNIKELLTEKDFIIEIDSFDKFMLMLHNKLNFKALIDKKNIENSQIVKNALSRAENYSNQLEELTKDDLDKTEQEAIKKLLPDWWAYELKIRNESDNNIKDDIYQEGMKTFPESHELLCNYGLFLYDIRKDYNKAEEYFKKAIFLDPNSIIYNGNYARFLRIMRKDYDKAELYYNKALEINPDHSNANDKYAGFLTTIRKDHNKAETHYKKALENNPNHQDSNSNYANFLQFIRKDYDKANVHYIKVLDSDPHNSNSNGNYAGFLLSTGKIEQATKYIDTAFSSLNTEMRKDVLLELWFYRLAHYPEFFDEAKQKLDELLLEGHRSIGWNFDGNIEQAEKNGVSDIALLKDYAKRITEE